MSGSGRNGRGGNRVSTDPTRHRSGRPGAPRRLVRHPVQVLRARHADVEAASRFVHRGLRPRSLHGAHCRRYRRWMGAERRQDRCSAEASVRGASLRRSRKSALRLARHGPGRTGGSGLPARAVQPAAPSESRVRRRDRRFRGAGSRQADHGLRHGQDLHWAAHRRSARRLGGRVLYLLPSISLFQQSMREWAEQRAVPHRYIGVCSDTRAGRNDEDASFQELEIPVTTDPAAISLALREARPQAMTSTCSPWTTRRSTGRSSTACLSPARSNKTCCRTTRSCFWPCRSSMSMRRCSDIWRPATGRSLRWRAPAHSPTP